MVSVPSLKEQFDEMGYEPTDDVIEKCKNFKISRWKVKLNLIVYVPQASRFAVFILSMTQSSLLRNSWRSAFPSSMELSRQCPTSTTSKSKNSRTKIARLRKFSLLDLRCDRSWQFTTRTATTTRRTTFWGPTCASHRRWVPLKSDFVEFLLRRDDPRKSAPRALRDGSSQL